MYPHDIMPFSTTAGCQRIQSLPERRLSEDVSIHDRRHIRFSNKRRLPRFYPIKKKSMFWFEYIAIIKRYTLTGRGFSARSGSKNIPAVLDFSQYVSVAVLWRIIPRTLSFAAWPYAPSVNLLRATCSVYFAGKSFFES